MGLMMAGLLGGLGRGLTEGTQIAYKEAMDKEKIAGAQAFQTQRDDVNNQRSVAASELDNTRRVDAATVADTRHAESKRVDFDNQLKAVSETIKIRHDMEAKFGTAAITGAQEIMKTVGGDFTKAIERAPTPDIAAALKGWSDFADNKLAHQSTLQTQAASRAGTYSDIGINKAREGRAVQQYADDAKVPKAVQMAYAPIQKELDVIAAALAKSQAEGTYNESSAKVMLDRQSLLTKRAQSMLSPYMGGKESSAAPAADKYGWNEVNAKSKAGAPAREDGRRQILMDELANEKVPENIAALNRELSRLGPTSSARAAAQSAAPKPRGGLLTQPATQSHAAAPVAPPPSNQRAKPSYQGWMAAKEKIDALKSAAKNMTGDRKDIYLSARLPDLEAELSFHAGYAKY